MFPPPEYTFFHHESDPDPSTVNDNGSPNAEAASSNEMPCFTAFDRAFRWSQLNCNAMEISPVPYIRDWCLVSLVSMLNAEHIKSQTPNPLSWTQRSGDLQFALSGTTTTCGKPRLYPDVKAFTDAPESSRHSTAEITHHTRTSKVAADATAALAAVISAIDFVRGAVDPKPQVPFPDLRHWYLRARPAQSAHRRHRQFSQSSCLAQLSAGLRNLQTL